MAALPPPSNTTGAVIDQAWHDAQPSNHRMHLGASVIGSECRRALWYGFRWVTDIKHPGRLLRLFNRGHEEENRFARDLQMIGVEFVDVDPTTGNQFVYSALGGHFGGSGDGLARGVPEAQNTPHIVEMKTHALKSFTHLAKHGVQESKPQHYIQMQMYMHWQGFERALYMAVCKNDDQLYTERVKYDQVVALQHIAKAEQIIFSPTPPARMNDDPGFYLCGWCDHKDTCHADKAGALNCRTCISATPLASGGWECDQVKGQLIPEDSMRTGCQAHRYMPELLPHSRPISASGRDITYQVIATDREYVNGPKADASYPSAELQHLAPAQIASPGIDLLREAFDGQVAETTNKPFCEVCRDKGGFDCEGCAGIPF